VESPSLVSIDMGIQSGILWRESMIEAAASGRCRGLGPSDPLQELPSWSGISRTYPSKPWEAATRLLDSIAVRSAGVEEVIAAR